MFDRIGDAHSSRIWDMNCGKIRGFGMSFKEITHCVQRLEMLDTAKELKSGGEPCR